MELNSETMLYLDYLGYLKDFRVLTIASLDAESRADEAANEWKGMVTSMKDYQRQVNKQLKSFIDQKITEKFEKTNGDIKALDQELKSIKGD